MLTTVVATAPLKLQADPNQVWDLLAEFDRWSTWNPTFRARGDARVGSRLLLFPRFLPGSVLPAVIFEAERGVVLSWGGGMAGAKATHTLRFEPGDDGCVLHHDEVFEGVLGAATAPLRSVLVGRYEAMNAAIAEQVVGQR